MNETRKSEIKAKLKNTSISQAFIYLPLTDEVVNNLALKINVTPQEMRTFLLEMQKTPFYEKRLAAALARRRKRSAAAKTRAATTRFESKMETTIFGT